MMVDILKRNGYLARMAKGSDSKEKTLAAAAKLFCRQGYHGTALHDILAASGAPRGSLYFHFPRGKEQIAEGAVAVGDNAVRAFIAHVAGTSRNAETFVANLARGMGTNLEASGFREGCPLATTALEIAIDSEAIGKATRGAFAAWEREIAQALISFGGERKQAGIIATAILSQVEGALLLARTYRTLEPMRRAEEALRVLVQSHRRRPTGRTEANKTEV
jgi:TetR/AcrR family transcriptional regulator, lmrAB and yxaGH operons repressor